MVTGGSPAPPLEQRPCRAALLPSCCMAPGFLSPGLNWTLVWVPVGHQPQATGSGCRQVGRGRGWSPAGGGSPECWVWRGRGPALPFTPSSGWWTREGVAGLSGAQSPFDLWPCLPRTWAGGRCGRASSLLFRWRSPAGEGLGPFSLRRLLPALPPNRVSIVQLQEWPHAMYLVVNKD